VLAKLDTKIKKGNSMLRKLIILAIAALMVAVAVVPAFASTNKLAVHGKFYRHGHQVGYFTGSISDLYLKSLLPQGEKMNLSGNIEGKATVQGTVTHVDRGLSVAAQIVANCDNTVTLDVGRTKMEQKNIRADLALADTEFYVGQMQGDHTLLKHALCSINDEMTPSQALADFTNELFTIRGLNR